MSETVYFKGKLKPTGKDLINYVDDHDIPDYYDSDEEYFNDYLSESAIVIDGKVFEVERTQFEDSDDIFESTKNEDGTIDFQVKYYNGGCCFGEALEYALKKQVI